MGVVANTVFANGLVLKANSSDTITGSNPIGLNDTFADALSLSGLAVGGSGSPASQTIAGALTISGALTLSSAVNSHMTVVSSAGPYAVAATDSYIAVTYTGGAMTITLPSSPTTGRVVCVKDGAGLAATNNITITATQTIDGVAGGTGVVINQNYGSLCLVYTGSVWFLYDFGVTPNVLSLTTVGSQTVTGPVVFSSAITLSGAATFSSAMYGHITTLSTAGPYAVGANDRYLVVTYTGAAMTITMPSSPTAGRLISVKDGVGGASVRNITITASQTIDGIAGGTGVVIAQNYGAIDLLYTGSVWVIT